MRQTDHLTIIIAHSSSDNASTTLIHSCRHSRVSPLILIFYSTFLSVIMIMDSSNTLIEDYSAPSVPRRKLDFLIAGFPKCGTTTLAHAFAAHDETDISLSERCDIEGNTPSPDVGPVHGNLQDILGELSADPKINLGAKCPTSLSFHRTLSMLNLRSPQTKLIVGVRHPVFYFESYYNYRVTELHTLGEDETTKMYTNKVKKAPVPPIETLNGSNVWLGVNTRMARFEVFLSQLGKTNMTVTEIENLKSAPQMAVVPNSFKVFLYSLEQMDDDNTTLKQNFQNKLESFLGLKRPLNIGHENDNLKIVEKNLYNDTINICDTKYDELRNELVSQGIESQRWLRDKFLKSADVTVANRRHFLQTIQAWMYDPCTF